MYCKPGQISDFNIAAGQDLASKLKTPTKASGEM